MVPAAKLVQKVLEINTQSMASNCAKFCCGVSYELVCKSLACQHE